MLWERAGSGHITGDGEFGDQRLAFWRAGVTDGALTATVVTENEVQVALEVSFTPTDLVTGRYPTMDEIQSAVHTLLTPAKEWGVDVQHTDERGTAVFIHPWNEET
jgi:hypothetical protein